MTKPAQYSGLAYLIGALVGINLLITAWHGVVSLRRKGTGYAEETYTYNGNSIPLLHPVQFELPSRPVALTLQESTHYLWNDSTIIARDEYVTLLKYQALSFLGPEHRQTITSWYHNFHCIAQIRAALYNHSDTVANVHHFGHCLQYLRQFLLCGATDTVEEGDFMEKDFKVDRVGSDLVCQDWEYAFATLRHEEDEFDSWYRNGQL
ncbi:hypothetical protein V5O48_003344 [Marasmius crinis-equi]|uniref:Uncharacterized protein n=1 Tax=Marasmius crinis-equi TaxID=585013 RepID=A0ABR3FT29_9AGAR